MISPVRNGKVPDSTPPLDQPIPLSRLDRTTAAPKAPVIAAVSVSRARRDSMAAGSVADQPALLRRNLADALGILGHVLAEAVAGQEDAALRGLLHIVLPLGRRLHLLHQVDVKRHLLG